MTGDHVVVDGPVVALRGRVDARGAGQMRRLLYDHLERWDHVVVDLADVPGVDVVALRVLAAASRQAERQGGSVTLRGCRGPVLRLLHLSRLRGLVRVEGAPSRGAGV